MGSQIAFAASEDPTLGAPAPKIDVRTWLKGTPVTTFDKNKLYVVEFWATWCGPCKQSIPHLTELAAKNKDVTFVGVSIWEDDTNGSVKKFVDDMGPKMAYNVAYSGNQDKMAVSWMKAYGQNGIPSAFVVKDGKIQWVGHPMSLEGPLAEIKSGKFNLAAAQQKFAQALEATKAEAKAIDDLKESELLYKQGKKTEASAKLDEAAKLFPQAAASAKLVRLGWLAKDDLGAWRKRIGELSASKDPEEVAMVGEFGVEQARPGGDVALGKEAIETVLKATNESNFLVEYYASMFYTQTKDNALALKSASKARDLLSKSEFNSPEFKAELDKQVKELSAAPKHN